MKTGLKSPPVVRVSSDRLRIVARLVVDPSEIGQQSTSIQSQMAELAVCKAALEVDIPALLLSSVGADPGEALNLLIHEGIRAKPPEHGKIEWTADFFSENFVVDENTGSMDFRAKASHREVSRDQHLCTATEPVDGTPGRDVFGNAIKAKRANRARIRGRENVEIRNENEYYSTCAGRIRWENDTLSVDSVYVVSGNVDLETGYIQHAGPVLVMGDVTPGSIVESTENIEVKGVIAGATVKAGENLVVGGGIVGGEDCVVEADKEIHAAYILDAHVISGGDITVEREIVQSTVNCGNRVLIPKGRIIGGHVHASRAIVAREIGSDAAIPTVVSVGESDSSRVARDELQARLAELEESRSKIERVVTPLSAHLDKLPPEKVAVVEKLKAQLESIAGEAPDIEAKLEELDRRTVPKDELMFEVSETIFAESRITIHREVKLEKFDKEGPLKITLRKGQMRYKKG